MGPTRSRRPTRRTLLASFAALPLAGALPACGGGARRVQPADFTLIANDFVGGVQFIDGDVRPAINAAGQIAFVGTELPPPPSGFSQAVFVSQPGGALAKLATQTLGFVDVDALQLAADGAVVVVATRDGVAPLRGVYRGDAGTLTALFEADPGWSFGDPGSPPPQARLALSPNGTLAFSTLVSGNGGIYRCPLAGPPQVLRAGSGIYFNNQVFAVNDTGQVVVQMEYGDPNAGLSRGLLVFDTPGDTLATIESAGERASVGWQPQVAINGAGQVAFAIDTPLTIQYFSPPLPGGGAPSSTQTIPAGVHLATPSPFGLPFTLTTIAGPADGYSNFRSVAVNDAGTVVFSASHGGESGVFFGNDPHADVIARTGESVTIAGFRNFFSVVRLGGLNNAGQLALQTSDYVAIDQRIWRVQLPAP